VNQGGYSLGETKDAETPPGGIVGQLKEGVGNGGGVDSREKLKKGKGGGGVGGRGVENP